MTLGTITGTQLELLSWLITTARETGHGTFRQVRSRGEPDRIHLKETARRREALWSDVDALQTNGCVWTVAEGDVGPELRVTRDLRVTKEAFDLIPRHPNDESPTAYAVENAAQARTAVPTGGDLFLLNRRGQLAIAARCCQRALPILQYSADGQRWADTANEALGVVEKVAQGQTSSRKHVDALLGKLKRIDVTASTDERVVDAVRSPESAAVVAAGAVVKAVSELAFAAVGSTESQNILSDWSACNAAYVAVRLAAKWFFVHPADSAVEFVRQAWRDYDELLRTGTPKTTKMFGLVGPLWFGTPPLWKPIGEELHTLEPASLEVYIDPGDASVETIQAVFDALSDLQAASGGLGLDFTPDEHGVLVAEEVRV